MRFLVKFIHIDPPGIIFQIYEWKKFWTTFPKFWHMTSFLPPKWGNLGYFHLKWPILTKFTPLMTCLPTFISINLMEIILETFREKIISKLSPNLVIWRNFGPQNDPILSIFTRKWHILFKITPLMTFLTRLLSINLPEIIFRNH